MVKYNKPRLIVLVAIAVVFAVVFLCMVAVQFSRNEALDHFASRVLAQMGNGDTDALFDAMHAEERERLGLTKVQFHRFVDWYRANTADVSPIGAPVFEGGQSGYLLVVTVPQRSGDHRCDLELVVNRTEEGPKCFLSRCMVATALVARYGDSSGTTSLRQTIGKAIVDGMNREQKTLTTFGLKGYVDTTSRFQLVTWPQYVRFAEKMSRQ